MFPEELHFESFPELSDSGGWSWRGSYAQALKESKDKKGMGGGRNATKGNGRLKRITKILL